MEGEPRPRSAHEILQERFPELRPVRSPPTLVTINGCGLTAYGESDPDPETGTFVKTHFLVVVFVPILALGAYRVARAPQGWYFLGKVPLGLVARWWNRLVLTAALALGLGIGWTQYTRSPTYRAQATLAEARRREAAGDLIGASERYAQLIGGPRGAEGLAALEAALGRLIPAAGPDELLRLTGTLVPYGAVVLPRQRVEAVIARASELSAEHPRQALLIMDQLRPLAEDAWQARREALLEALLRAEPGDLAAAGELAGRLEARGQTEACRALLEPLADRLGASDGARVLGLLRLQAGELAGARALLVPFLKERLPALHSAEEAYQKALDQAQADALEQLRAGAASRAWYQRYDTLGEEEQQEAVGTWIRERMQKSALISAARARLDQAGDLVGLALDTGTLLLTLAQELTGEERKREVETAEQLFLAVQGVAGDSPMFRLGLARVHYWLGRPEQGRALLEELVAEDEDAHVHLAVARTLREVGAQSDAIGLAERVWQTSSDEQVKRAAAGFLASVVGDLDQRLTWGERSDPQDPGERASLLDTKALRSLRDGDLATAEQQLRAAAELYRGLPPRSATLNNHALVAGRLFVISGRAADLDLQIDLLLQAERLEQGNSVIKSNLVWALMERAALRTLGREGIDMGALRAVPGAGHLDWACADGAALARVTGEWAEEPDLKEIHTRLRALRVLAPRDPDHHLVCLTSLGLGRDLTAHQELLRCLEGADLDLALASRSELSSQAAARVPLEEREQVALRRALELRRARLDALPSDASPATRAMGRALLLQTQLAAFTSGEPVELDPLVAEAEALLRAAPSLGALDLLGDLCLERALARATPRSPALKAMRERTGRALGADVLVPLAMEGSSEVRELLATDPDLQRAAALVRRRHAAFPDDRRPRDWALLRALGPDDPELAALAEAIGGDQILALRLAAYLRLNPLEPRSVTSSMWLQGLKGDREAARAVLDRAVQAGMVFPYTY